MRKKSDETFLEKEALSQRKRISLAACRAWQRFFPSQSDGAGPRPASPETQRASGCSEQTDSCADRRRRRQERHDRRSAALKAQFIAVDIKLSDDGFHYILSSDDLLWLNTAACCISERAQRWIIPLRALGFCPGRRQVFMMGKS